MSVFLLQSVNPYHTSYMKPQISMTKFTCARVRYSYIPSNPYCMLQGNSSEDGRTSYLAKGHSGRHPRIDVHERGSRNFSGTVETKPKEFGASFAGSWEGRNAQLCRRQAVVCLYVCCLRSPKTISKTNTFLQLNSTMKCIF